MPHSVIGGVVFALAPTILVGLLFWYILRAIMRSDRTERKVYSEIEAEERARAEASEGRGGAAATGTGTGPASSTRSAGSASDTARDAAGSPS